MLERRNPPSAKFIASTNAGPGVALITVRYARTIILGRAGHGRDETGQLIDTDQILPREELRKTSSTGISSRR
ncbi:hypothetical protein MZO42_10885 [Sphingomonas psychrotolerans]|uniref:Uncharacterized protein n=1 Tax=Sphingomonas psychrotolerans TaxID=1327635 RepID=A0ABU3N412_9SPHN|nr:hypothetical protein [Sphingomonas psychrotolerans]